MRYLCIKQLTAGGVTYHPGEVIPDGGILPERSGKLLKSGYISEFSEETGQALGDVPKKLFTQEEVVTMIAEAVAEVEKKKVDQLAELQEYVAKLSETEAGAYDGTVQIAVKGASDGENGQFTTIPASTGEIQQVFSIMQLNAEEGARVVADVKSENVLILLHAADSRKTIKNAAKEQADKLFSIEGGLKESSKGNETTDTNTEGS